MALYGYPEARVRQACEAHEDIKEASRNEIIVTSYTEQ